MASCCKRSNEAVGSIKRGGISEVAEEPAASKEGFHSMESVGY